MPPADRDRDDRSRSHRDPLRQMRGQARLCDATA
jgi:hypothetical protein